MAEPGPRPQSGRDADRDAPPPMPRWVKVAAILVGVLILLFVILRFAGVGGDHGPGQHSSDSRTPSESASSVEAAVGAEFG